MIEINVRYQFQAEGAGRCQLTNRTKGNHGFGLPKLFVIESVDQPELGQFTYRYADNVVEGVHSGEFSNAVLCRIAIAQFLATARLRDGVASIVFLDVTIRPYAGEVLNTQGTVLTQLQLHSPRSAAKLPGSRQTSVGQRPIDLDERKRLRLDGCPLHPMKQ